jgi:hypothetical protein
MELAEDLANRLESEAIKHEKLLGGRFDVKRARSLRAVAKEARTLIRSLKLWFKPEVPDYSQRMMDVTKYHEITARAKELGVPLHD